MELEPIQAAKLAEEVYAVQDEAMLSLFLKRPEFSGNDRSSAVLTAEVGARLLNTKDAFAVCAVGSGPLARADAVGADKADLTV